MLSSRKVKNDPNPIIPQYRSAPSDSDLDHHDYFVGDEKKRR